MLTRVVDDVVLFDAALLLSEEFVDDCVRSDMQCDSISNALWVWNEHFNYY